MKNKPLSGIRVLDLSTFLAAPICARLLADWGADVIKVEPLSGDPQRNLGASMKMPTTDDENPAWEFANSNKRSISIDLKQSAGQEMLQKLLEDSDVLVTNYRKNTLSKLNLTYEELKQKYPKLIYAHVTGYGNQGAEVNSPGYDSIAFWARSGFMVDMPEPGHSMSNPGTLGDTLTGTVFFGGVCAALLGRQHTGKGDKVNISLYHMGIWMASLPILATAYGYKYPRKRTEYLPTSTTYQCKDGEWLMITLANHNKEYPRLCKALGLEELIDDHRFNNLPNLNMHRSELLEIMEERFAQKKRDEWLRLLSEADIVNSRMSHFNDNLRDEQALANNFISEKAFPSGNRVMMPTSPIQSTSLGKMDSQRAPYLGEHTNEVLTNMGYSFQQIEELSQDKIIRIR